VLPVNAMTFIRKNYFFLPAELKEFNSPRYDERIMSKFPVAADFVGPFKGWIPHNSVIPDQHHVLTRGGYNLFEPSYLPIRN